MSITLSFILPAYNAEKTIACQIRSLLDLLAELGVPFELLVIDDGSVDDTLGEARELKRRFSQVRTIHRPLRYGHSAAVQLGLRETTAPFVLIYNDRSRRLTTEIQELWLSCLAPSNSADELAATPAGIDSTLGTVRESGPLLLVQRWDLASVSLLENSGKYSADIRTVARRQDPSSGDDQVDRPYYLSPAGTNLYESVW